MAAPDDITALAHPEWGDAQVNVVDRDGNQAGTVPAKNLAKAQAAGYRLEGEDETHERNLQQTYGEGFGNELRAGVESGLSTASFGLSDLIGQVGGGGEGLRERRERNPTASLVGGAAGALIDPFGTGSLVARGGKALGEKLVGSSLGRTVIKSGTEGLFAGVGSGVSNVALSDHPMSAESIGAELGTNALFGTGIGLGLGGLGGLLHESATAARGATQSFLAREAEGSVAAEMAATEKPLSRASAADVGGEAATPAAREAHVQARAEGAVGVREDISAARASSEEMLAKSRPLMEAGAAPPELEAAHGDLVATTRRLNGIADLAKGSDAAVERNAPKIAEALEQHSQAVKSVRDILEPPAPAAVGMSPQAPVMHGAEAAEEAPGILDSLKETGIDKAKEFLSERVKDAAKETIGPMLGGTLGHLVAGPLGGMIGSWGGSALSRLLGGGERGAEAGTAHAVTTALETKLAGVVARAAGVIDTGVDGFMAAGKVVGKAAPAGASRVLANATFSPTAPATPPPPKGAPQPAGDTIQHFRRVVSELGAAVANLPGTIKHLHDQLAGVRAVDPKLGDQMETLATKQVQFLASKIPPSPQLGSIDNPQRWQPSDATISKFARFVAGATEGPARLMNEMKAGRLSAETVEAVKALYPATFERIQAGIMDRVTDLKKTLPYDKRLTLSILFDVPADSTMRPAFVQAMQANFVLPPPKQSQSSGTPKLGTSKPPAGVTAAQKTTS